MIKDVISEYNKLREKVVRVIAEVKNYIINYNDILTISITDDKFLFVYYLYFEEDTHYDSLTFPIEWLDLSDEDLKKAVDEVKINEKL